MPVITEGPANGTWRRSRGRNNAVVGGAACCDNCIAIDSAAENIRGRGCVAYPLAKITVQLKMSSPTQVVSVIISFYFSQSSIDPSCYSITPVAFVSFYCYPRHFQFPRSNEQSRRLSRHWNEDNRRERRKEACRRTAVFFVLNDGCQLFFSAQLLFSWSLNY